MTTGKGFGLLFGDGLRQDAHGHQVWPVSCTGRDLSGAYWSCARPPLRQSGRKTLRTLPRIPVRWQSCRATRKSGLAALDELECTVVPALKWAVINYESTHRDGIFTALHDYAADLIICDESQRIANHAAAQSKGAAQTGRSGEVIQAHSLGHAHQEQGHRHLQSVPVLRPARVRHQLLCVP